MCSPDGECLSDLKVSARNLSLSGGGFLSLHRSFNFPIFYIVAPSVNFNRSWITKWLVVNWGGGGSHAMQPVSANNGIVKIWITHDIKGH